jgi:hypothetical protein
MPLEPTDSNAMKIVKWIAAKGISGVPPLSSKLKKLKGPGSLYLC